MCTHPMRSGVHAPRLIVCDEPTAAFDAQTVLKILKDATLAPDRAVIVSRTTLASTSLPIATRRWRMAASGPSGLHLPPLFREAACDDAIFLAGPGTAS